MVSRFIRRSPQWRIRQKIKEKVEPSDGGPTVSPQASPPSEQITPQQAHQESVESERQIGEAVSYYQGQIEWLESKLPPGQPSRLAYTYELEIDGKKQIISGHDLRRYYRKELKKTQTYYVQSQEARSQFRDIAVGGHPDIKIVKTPLERGGYEYQTNVPFVGAERYKQHERTLKKGGVPMVVATAFTPEDPLGIPSAYYSLTGQKKKAQEMKVKSIARIESIKTPEMGIKWYSELPTTQIGLSMLGGYGVGKGLGYAGGRLSTSIAGTRALQIGGAAVGVGLAAPTVIDVKSTWEAGKKGEAVGKASMFGFMAAGGYAGYKMGTQSTSSIFKSHRGLTTYERGAKTAHIKMMEKGIAKGTIKPDVGEAVIQATKARASILKDIRGRGLKPHQPDIDFGKIQSLKDQPSMTRWFKRQLPMRKSEVYGGAASDKPSTHDIDLMYRSPLRHIESEYASMRLTDTNVKKFADIHPWVKKGKILSRMGELKEPPIKHPSGIKSQRWTEQFAKLSRSVLHMEHKGRTKDVQASLNLLDKIYKGTGGMPESIKPSVQKYTKASLFLEKDPLVMSKETASYIYGTNWAKKLYETKKGFYRKILPGRIKERGFKKVYDPTSEQALLKADVKIKNLAKDKLGETDIYYARDKLGKYPVYRERPEIRLSPDAYKIGEGKLTLKHEMIHQLHPRATERMVLMAEKISHPMLDKLSAFKLPKFQPSVSSRGFLPSSGIGGMISGGFVSRLPSKSVVKPSYSYPIISRSIGISKSIKSSKSNIYNIFKSSVVSQPRSSILTSSTSKVVSPKVSSSVSKSSSMYSSSSYMYTGYGLPPPKLGGKGAKSWDKKTFGRRYRFRKFNVKDLLGG